MPTPFFPSLSPMLAMWIAATVAVAQPATQPLSATRRAAGTHGGPRQYLQMPAAWYAGDQAKAVVKIVLTHQSDLGGWPKNVDTTARPSISTLQNIHGTFDNNATFDELRLLARVYNAAHEATLVPPIEHGIDLILKSQYPTGGWPQSYPPDDEYHRYITYNDGAMARLLFFLKEVNDTAAFAFLDAGRREACRASFERGVDCILKCQIKVDGRLTGWCAQHDEKDYSPRAGRAFEPVSISGSESVDIVRLLMSIETPTAEQIAAVDAAAAWFDRVRIPGIRTEDRPTPGGRDDTDRLVIDDAAAKPMWARFYEVGTNRPIFSDRDGVIKYRLSEIGPERRNGYRWLGYWPQSLLATEYPAWKAKHHSATPAVP